MEREILSLLATYPDSTSEAIASALDLDLNEVKAWLADHDRYLVMWEAKEGIVWHVTSMGQAWLSDTATSREQAN